MVKSGADKFDIFTIGPKGYIDLPFIGKIRLFGHRCKQSLAWNV